MRQNNKWKNFLFREALLLPWRHRAKALAESLLDLGICLMLGSHWFERLIDYTDHAWLRTVLFELRALEDYFDLIKVLLGIALYLAIRLFRSVLM